MAGKPCILWFRQDLRLEDNPALVGAVSGGGPVIPLYIWAPDEEGEWSPGSASRVWIHQSLRSLEGALRTKGSALILREGECLAELRAVIRETVAEAVYWNRRYEPRLIERDQRIKSRLEAEGIRVESFNSSLLFEPGEVKTRQGTPFKVFTPFWKACLIAPEPPDPIPCPRRIPAPARFPRSTSLEELGLEPKQEWAQGVRRVWEFGEKGAHRALTRFLAHGLAGYSEGRDCPGLPGTSRLSPYLHHGELSPRTVWTGVVECIDRHPGARSAAQDFLREVIWREFAHHILYHFPTTVTEPLREAFNRFPWRADADALGAWRRGRTGYPLVDAGMRELWATGWMHNRVRMIVASFLTKDLRVSWREGARWFWDTLVDADLANNTFGWQWTAGCGADAAPFFRVFNPSSQGERFDPQGLYVRRWVPELRGLPDRWIHRPSAAPKAVLHAAGVTLGKDYPLPVVDHVMARAEALEAYQGLRG